MLISSAATIFFSKILFLFSMSYFIKNVLFLLYHKYKYKYFSSMKKSNLDTSSSISISEIFKDISSSCLKAAFKLNSKYLLYISL